MSDLQEYLDRIETEADVIVVNTCCFINDAKEESINTLIEMGALKEIAKVKVLIATGCLAQRYAKEIREEIPEVDAVVGTTGYEKIAEIFANTANNEKEHAKLWFKHLQGGKIKDTFLG